MLIVLRQLFNNLLVSLKLPRGVLHWVQNKNTLRNVLVFMGCEPIWKDGVRSLRLIADEFHDLYTTTLEGVLKVIELFLGL